jgi:hypothetical protein
MRHTTDLDMVKKRKQPIIASSPHIVNNTLKGVIMHSEMLKIG